MRLETDGRSVEVVSRPSELLETVGLASLFIVPFALAGALIGLALVAGIVFTAVVIHSAIRYS